MIVKMKKKTFHQINKSETHTITGKELQDICKPVYADIINEYLNLDDHYNIIADISSYNIDEVAQEVIVVGKNGEGYIIVTINGIKQVLKI